MSYQHYPSYKNSGIEWLGQVPSHWKVISIKWLSSVLRGASPRPIDNPIFFDDEGEYAWVRIADATASNGVLFETTQRLSELGSSLSVKLEPNKLFVSIAGTVGKPCITGIKACIHDGFVHFPKLKIDQRLLFRVFEAGVCYGGLGKMGTQLNLNTDSIGSIRIAVPPVHELNLILSFLDRETAKIDDLAKAFEGLITTLKEKRQAVVSHAVTKGLDSSVPMKDSGIEWLGDVPEHWGVGQSRRLFALRNERASESDKQLTASQEHGVIYQEDFVRLEGRRVVQVIKGADILKHVEPNDFVISMRSFQGGIEWCKYRGCISSAYVMLNPCDRVHGPFFYYLLKSKSYIQALQTTSNLVRDGQALRYDNFTQVDLPLVPLKEQIQIAAFLDREIENIDTLATEAQIAIDLLQERRTALISAAVTGKIDVRGLAIHVAKEEQEIAEAA